MSVEHLLLALDNAYKVCSYYKLVSPFNVIFQNLQFAEQEHINVLNYHLQQLDVTIPQNPYLQNMPLPNSLESMLEAAIDYENAKIALYNTLLETEQSLEIMDTFYRMQAVSFNNHLPVLHNALMQVRNTQNLNTIQGIMELLNEGKEILHQTGMMVTQLKEGTLSQMELEGFLSRLSYSLIGGVVAGAFGAMIIKEILNQNKE